MSKNKKKLMVVDDEREICNFVKSFFEQRGFQVEQAFNGEHAIKSAKEFNPDIILLDIFMNEPDDGLKALPKLKEICSEARILMTTAVDDEVSVVRAKSLGAVDYITKPLVLEELESSVYKQVGITKK